MKHQALVILAMVGPINVNTFHEDIIMFHVNNETEQVLLWGQFRQLPRNVMGITHKPCVLDINDSGDHLPNQFLKFPKSEIGEGLEQNGVKST